jgi:nucleotide-binding universal stress UspA family protein
VYRKIVVGHRPGERDSDALALARVLAAPESVEDVLVVEAAPGESAVATLTAAAEREGADLLVLGPTHHGFAGRLLARTTAGSILPDATYPVAVAPAGYDHDATALREIAVAYDASPEAHAALDWAVDVAAAMDAHLRLVAVLAPSPPIDAWGASVPGEAWNSGVSYAQAVEAEDVLRERMDRELAAAAASAGRSDTATATLVGNPAHELREVATEVDMLVVGSHRHGALFGTLFGSVSRGLAHNCPSPLVVVP